MNTPVGPVDKPANLATNIRQAEVQPRLDSAVESVTNVVVGYVLSVLTQRIVFPGVGVSIGLGTNLWIGVWFTAVSLLRSYAIRRFFAGKGS